MKRLSLLLLFAPMYGSQKEVCRQVVHESQRERDVTLFMMNARVKVISSQMDKVRDYLDIDSPASIHNEYNRLYEDRIALLSMVNRLKNR